MLLVGVDDTDSRQGGCTTVLAAALTEAFSELQPASPPRLVRLNPNVPWKTRGNGAVAVAFHGAPDLADALERARVVVARHARDGSEPGVVVSRAPLGAALYDVAVSRVVERAEADEAVARAGALAWGGRGVIGAASALAWSGARATWERIAYREPSRVGAPRAVAPERVREVELAHPSLFDSFDLVEDDVVCVPSSPCPVLWGLRGLDPADLERASATLGPERPVAETTFLTNHASDDHLRDREVANVRARESSRVRVVVADRPRERNGHVFLDARDETGAVRAAAYAPTRSFRRVVAALREGDEVTLAGGAMTGPDGRVTIGLEKLEVRALARRKAGNPLCPACGRSMKSAGRAAGYRCKACRTSSAVARAEAAPLALGWYEVPASARRHLARPLRLGP